MPRNETFRVKFFFGNSDFWNAESTMTKTSYRVERPRRMGVDGNPLFYSRRITEKPVTDEFIRTIPGVPIPNLSDLNVSLDEQNLLNRWPMTLNSYVLRCIDNPNLHTLIIGVQYFGAVEFIITKALYSGIRVKLVDVSNHETHVFMPEAPAPLDARSPRKVRYLSRLPQDQQTDRTRTRCEWKSKTEYPPLHIDDKEWDINGRNYERFKPQIHRLRRWQAENQAWHRTEKRVMEENIAIQCGPVTIDLNDPEPRKTQTEYYKTALEKANQLLALPETQAYWNELIEYGLQEEQYAFIHSEVQVGDPLHKDFMPLLQCLYECEYGTGYRPSKIEDMEMWLSLVYYVSIGEKPTCYNHHTMTPKKWALERDDENDFEALLDFA
jgi:hypothetical protein